MNAHLPTSLSRLASVNPAPVDDDLGCSAEAQAELARILASEPEPVVAPRRERRWAPRRLLLVALPAMVFLSGAVAAADPFGWWRSPNPDTAIYGANRNAHVRTPTVEAVRCEPMSSGFRCGPGLRGRPYLLSDRISTPPANVWSRALIRRSIAHRLATGTISEPVARRVLADLARVPASFFREMNAESIYGTYQGGPDPINGVQLVPPPGVPSFLACQPDGALLTCQDLNGDKSAPVGSGIYMAQQTADWRPAPRSRPNPLPPGTHALTTAEFRLMVDLGRYDSHTTHTASSSSSG